jgi:Killing trait
MATMANETSANSQITDAMTQACVNVIGEGPPQSVVVATQAMAHASALAMANATQAQGGMQQINNTAAAAVIAMIMGAGPKIPVDPKR